MLVMADRYGAPKLKEKSLKIIVEKKKDIVKLDEWKKFVRAYPDLTVEITTML